MKCDYGFGVLQAPLPSPMLHGPAVAAVFENHDVVPDVVAHVVLVRERGASHSVDDDTVSDASSTELTATVDV
jgi:hypothetical protein